MYFRTPQKALTVTKQSSCHVFKNCCLP